MQGSTRINARRLIRAAGRLGLAGALAWGLSCSVLPRGQLAFYTITGAYRSYQGASLVMIDPDGPVPILRGQPGGIGRLSGSPDMNKAWLDQDPVSGRLMALGLADPWLSALDPQEGSHAHLLLLRDPWLATSHVLDPLSVEGMAYSPAGACYVLRSQELCRVDPASGKLEKISSIVGAGIRSGIDFRPDGMLVLIGNHQYPQDSGLADESFLYVIDPANAQVLARTKLDRVDEWTDIDCAADGLVYGLARGRPWVIDPATGAVTHFFGDHWGPADYDGLASLSY